MRPRMPQLSWLLLGFESCARRNSEEQSGMYEVVGDSSGNSVGAGLAPGLNGPLN